MTNEMKARVETTLKNLRRNRMEAYYVDTKEQACELVKTLIQPGDTLSCGGSVTLKETGVYDIISSEPYRFLDRSACQTREEVEEIYRKTFCADAFFTSANAVTENGELYNVDGNSNRVAAILYGPKSVICFCGVNKLVKNIRYVQQNLNPRLKIGGILLTRYQGRRNLANNVVEVLQEAEKALGARLFAAKIRENVK